ncbi:MAG TPA: porin [Flavobacterium sp.]|uniref:porin n=1 Tax=Flavobacterium sp. TaxID=239 RepID=UPI002CF3B2FF|nr:porin [Flavobacterium sp.]HSD14728.1 porin [Flavobacterium sp.]
MKNNKDKVVFTRLLLMSGFLVSAQDTIPSSKVKIDFSGYIETFYTYDFNRPESVRRQDFLYNHNRHNEFNINMALLRSAVSYENFYAKIAIQAGTYVQDNYVNEDLKIINEANIGAYLDKNQKTSIEAGIFTSHIGFETAASASNLNLTRSLLAEGSPYFLTGVKVNYKPNEKWAFTGMLNNGWQRINKPNRNALPAFSSQIVYKSTPKSTLNWSTFVGDEPIGDNLRTRYFSNLYWDYQWNAKWRTIAGFDYGLQKRIDGEDYANWYSPIVIMQYGISDKWQIAYRSEYYQDKENIVIPSTYGSFKTIGNSLNLDFLPNTKVKIRGEARWLHSDTENFKTQSGYSKDNVFITTAMSFEF